MNIEAYVNERGDKFTILDHHHLPKYIITLSDAIAQNTFMRDLYASEPFKYFDSESILNSIVSRLKTIKIDKETLSIMSKNTTFINDLVNLLIHPNPDISLHIVLFLEEVVTNDHDDHDHEDYRQNTQESIDDHIDYFLETLISHNKFLDSLLYYTKRLDWNRQEEFDSINSTMVIIDGITSIINNKNMNNNNDATSAETRKDDNHQKISSAWIEWMTINCTRKSISSNTSDETNKDNIQHSLVTVKLAIAEQLLCSLQVDVFLSIQGISLIMNVFLEHYYQSEREEEIQSIERVEYLHTLADIFCACFVKDAKRSFQQFCSSPSIGKSNDQQYVDNHELKEQDHPQGFTLFWNILKKTLLIRIDVIRMLSFILSNSSDACMECVKSGGLRVIFPIFNGKGQNSMLAKYHHYHHYNVNEEEHQLVLVILSLVLKLPFNSDDTFTRVIKKIKEKRDKIVQLFKWSLQHIQEEEYQEQLSILMCASMIKDDTVSDGADAEIAIHLQNENHQHKNNENNDDTAMSSNFVDKKEWKEARDETTKDQQHLWKSEESLIAYEIAKEYSINKMNKETLEFKQLEKILDLTAT